MRIIKWNSQAKLDYYQNIDYLLERWSEVEAQKFIKQVSEIEFILRQGDIYYQDTDYTNVKRCLINRQITLFYLIEDSENIEFLRFLNNRKNINDLKFD